MGQPITRSTSSNNLSYSAIAKLKKNALTGYNYSAIAIQAVQRETGAIAIGPKFRHKIKLKERAEKHLVRLD